MAATAELDQVLTVRLRKSGHRVTSQRLLVHRAVCGEQRHLTAEQVLGSVTEALPSISLPTIYATLELLEDLGLVRRVSTGTGALLFESRRIPHAHAACRRCGKIVDVPAPMIDPEALQGARAAGFEPDEAQLIVFGLCESCRAAASSSAVA
ncbi:MAG: Fur family transcriptional regulator [Solirubrobacteraceae bacterium]